MPTPPQDAAPAPPALPETSAHEPQVRPWELELLISGAVVFSLLQLPGWVDDQYARVRLIRESSTMLGLMMLYVYIKVSLYTLIIAFLTHLAARGYWVGLIGLESVYPRGINWDNTNYGPVTTEVYRERLGRIQTHIDAADRFCSVLFPLAFSLVSFCLYSLLLMGVFSGVAYLATLVAGDPGVFVRSFMVAVVVFTIIPGLVWVADRRLGRAAEPGGTTHLRLRRLATIVFYLSALPVTGVMFTTLYSNGRRSMRYPLVLAGIALLFAYVFAHDVMVREGLLGLNGSALYPEDAGEMAVAPSYYADQRLPGGDYDREPFIQSEVIRGPYVRLFIPFVPLLHGESLPEGCPGLREVNAGRLRLGRVQNADTARTRAVLACWTRLQPVTLNGRVIAPGFRFSVDPRTGIRGIVAQIPVQGLPRGQNVLSVAPTPRTAESRRRRADADPAVIWFWL